MKAPGGKSRPGNGHTEAPEWRDHVRLKKISAQLKGQFAEGTKLEKAIRENLKGLGYEA
jgi:hypothetical protein